MHENWDELVGRLRAVVIELDQSLTRQEVDSIWQLIDAGEPGIAFEMLCDQLSELSVMVDGEMAYRLRVIGTTMGLESGQWEVLGEGN